MAIETQVLGQPGRDNALWVRIDTGQRVHRLLFDCGDGCLDTLGYGAVAEVDELLFSHFHMDHVGGFDDFFRCNFNREGAPVSVWGPPGAGDLLHHRFRGFWWNLIDGSPGEWIVRDVTDAEVRESRFTAADAFATRRVSPPTPRTGPLISNADYTLDAITLDHGGPTLGYVVRERPRVNIDASRLAEAGLRPGPWMQTLKGPSEQAEIEINGESHLLARLRERLLVETPGDSVAYLTDFALDDAETERLAAWLGLCGTLVCEAQYAPDDHELAKRNHHTTVTQGANLAAAAGVGRLVLFHLSDRYAPQVWSDMLEAARERFAETHWPEHWPIG